MSPSPREAGNGWVLDAVFPNGKQAAIAGFTTESEANNWLGSARHVSWLRDARSTFRGRSAVEIFERLGSCSVALLEMATELCQSIRHRWRDEARRLGHRGISTILPQLRACAWRCAASNWALTKRWAAELPGSRLRYRTVYRGLLAATVAFLVLVTVLWISLAVLVTLGDGERPARPGLGATQFTRGSPIVSSHSGGAETSDPIALLLDRVSATEIATELPAERAAESPPPPSAGEESPAVDVGAVTPRRELQRAAAPSFVGVWAPLTGSCSTRLARDGVLPAIISERGARAGETSCVFKEQRWAESDWRVLADCTNGHERWTSSVRLIVKGDRLVWTSKRGTQTYRRCRSNT